MTTWLHRAHFSLLVWVGCQYITMVERYALSVGHYFVFDPEKLGPVRSERA